MEPAGGHAERDDAEDKGGDEPHEEVFGFRPICRIAWHGKTLAVARFSELQIYSTGTALPNVGVGPLRLHVNTSGSLINQLQWSADGSRILVASDDKKLLLIDTSTWHVSQTKQLSKKATASTLTRKSPYRIIYADKQGEIWILPAHGDAEGEGEFLLGHVSLITDIALPADEVVILTADRDEKIRVSRFPQAAVIENYCLGHTQFVSRLLLPPTRRGIVISGSGDNTIRVWNYFTGKLLHTYTREGATEAALIPTSWHNGNFAVIVTQGTESTVEVLQLNADSAGQTSIERNTQFNVAAARVQDAVFDSAGVLWTINESGVVAAHGSIDAATTTLVSTLNAAGNSVAAPAKVFRSRLAKKKVDEDPQVVAPSASSLPAYVRKALGAERPEYEKRTKEKKGEKRKEKEREEAERKGADAANDGDEDEDDE